MVTKLALIMSDQELAETYQSWLALGRQNYENKLWTGSYYKIDTGSSKEKIDWYVDGILKYTATKDIPTHP